MSSNSVSFFGFLLYFFNNLLDESGGGRGVTLVKEDELGVVILVKEAEVDESGGGRGVTLVKEDELGVVILVKEGELGGPGRLDEPGGPGGPGSIGNPAKLSLISFNNFIMPSS